MCETTVFLAFSHFFLFDPDDSQSPLGEPAVAPECPAVSATAALQYDFAHGSPLGSGFEALMNHSLTELMNATIHNCI